jgi:hypothetical protein
MLLLLLFPLLLFDPTVLVLFPELLTLPVLFPVVLLLAVGLFAVVGLAAGLAAGLLACADNSCKGISIEKIANTMSVFLSSSVFKYFICVFLVRRLWRLFNFAIWNPQYSCALGVRPFVGISCYFFAM